jgi:LysM repeat protein
MSLQKQILFISSFLFSSVFSMAQLHSEVSRFYAPDSTKINYLGPNHIAITDSIINYGKLFLNTPYHRGSSGVNSFDCSGFTSFVYRNFGYDLQRSSFDQAKQVDTVDRHNLKAGDLVFFSGRHRSKRVGHVGIVVMAREDGKFNFIHASVHNGVIISNSDEPYYTRRFIKAGRVIFNNQMMVVAPSVSTSKSTLSETLADNPPASISSSAIQTKKVIPAEYHRVKKGETLSSIALKYGISLAKLKRKNNIKGNKINPKQRIKVKDEETILLVETVKTPVNSAPELTENQTESPKVEQKLPVNQTNTLHTVKKGETLFIISKLYNISVEELKKINNLISSKLRFGQKIKLAQSNNSPTTNVIAEKTETKIENNQTIKTENIVKTRIHKIRKGESLYTIAMKNNISVDELKKINHLTGTKIRFGQELKITQATETQNSSIEKKEIAPKIIRHKVKSGESFYSIAKIYGCKIEELKDWNKKTGSKIKVGERIVIYQKAE